MYALLEDTTGNDGEQSQQGSKKKCEIMGVVFWRGNVGEMDIMEKVIRKVY